VRVLVCGGTGLVGGAIIKKLKERNYTDIHATYFSKDPPRVPDVIWHKVDLRRQQDTEELFAKVRPNHVYLAAARVGGILANNTYKAQFIYDNLAIALNVIECAWRFKVDKLLNLGSSCIYPKHAPQPMKEEHLLTGPLEPTNEPYAIAKIAAIKLVRYYNEQYGTNFISVMPTNLYGPNDNFNLETSHVLPALIRKFHLAKLLERGDMDGIKRDLKRTPIGFGLDGKIDHNNEGFIVAVLEKIGISRTKDSVIVTLWGSGEVYREFLYSEDLADACVYLMEKVDAWQMRELCHDYFVNVGTGKDVKIKHLVDMIEQIVGFKAEVVYDRTKPDGTPRKLLDVSKINQLGWSAKTELYDGIKSVYEYYLSGQRGERA
jgi:GDP-L-fucose synthase